MTPEMRGQRPKQKRLRGRKPAQPHAECFLAYAVLYMVWTHVQGAGTGALPGYLAAGAAWPVELFRNWKYSELGSTTSTSLEFENDDR